jgi:hypothetical protein
VHFETINISSLLKNAVAYHSLPGIVVVNLEIVGLNSGIKNYELCHQKVLFKHWSRVARWFVIKPKIPIWGKNFGASDWKMLIYFMAI